MPRLKLTIAYDGSDFHGWQRQPGLRTVQGVLEDLVRRVCGQRVNLVGASRTDAGVHAYGQVAHVDYDGPIPPASLCKALNHRLPVDLAVMAVEPVAARFHATTGAIGKVYQYRVYAAEARPAALGRLRTAWHVWHRLERERLRAAAARLVGTHDFAGFATQGSPRETTVRTVWAVTVRAVEREIVIDVSGDGFLYNQVRNMVGTLIEIGRGRWEPDRIDRVLASRDRADAGPTAPPQGLTLRAIRYPPELERC
jgi:tRNA pseudouridine38-40 synthase